MTASRLRALDAEMTPGPWRSTVAADGTPNGEAFAGDASFYLDVRGEAADAEGICYLRNHAAALAEVVEAARALADHHLGTLAVPEGYTPDPRGDVLAFRRAIAIRAALARLEDADGK